MEETTELRLTIENLYATFASYPLRDDTNACPCCHSPEDEKRLHRTSLRKLNAGDLREYTTDALFVWGSEADFKHFLPRIFELAAAHGEEFVDPEVVFNKLRHGDWEHWPDVEQRAVEQFFHALWRCILDGQPHEYYGWQIEGWLCGISKAVSDLSPYLKTWIEMETENSRLNLAGFIADTDFANPNSHATAYWEDSAEMFAEVGNWVRGNVVKERMNAIAAEYSQYDFVERAYISLP